MCQEQCLRSKSVNTYFTTDISHLIKPEIESKSPADIQFGEEDVLSFDEANGNTQLDRNPDSISVICKEMLSPVNMVNLLQVLSLKEIIRPLGTSISG